MQGEYKGFRFSDSDVVEPGDFIPAGEYNPHNVRPWLIYNEVGTLAIVFASNEQDALDGAMDGDKLNSVIIDRADYDAMTEEERDDLAYLGNASEPCDLSYVGIVELPNPSFSWVAMFNASKE